MYLLHNNHATSRGIPVHVLVVCVVSPFGREHGATMGGMVVNPACGNLNKEREYIAIPVPA